MCLAFGAASKIKETGIGKAAGGIIGGKSVDDIKKTGLGQAASGESVVKAAKGKPVQKAIKSTAKKTNSALQIARKY